MLQQIIAPFRATVLRDLFLQFSLYYSSDLFHRQQSSKRCSNTYCLYVLCNVHFVNPLNREDKGIVLRYHLTS